MEENAMADTGAAVTKGDSYYQLEKANTSYNCPALESWIVDN
jgi:hypothetical protein